MRRSHRRCALATPLEVAGDVAAPPEKKPLRMPTAAPGAPAVPVRELPNGRGFLRLVKNGGTPAPKAPDPQPSPATPATSTPSTPVASALAFDVNGQADLFSWTQPKRALQPEPSVVAQAPKRGQLTLFLED